MVDKMSNSAWTTSRFSLVLYCCSLASVSPKCLFSGQAAPPPTASTLAHNEQRLKEFLARFFSAANGPSGDEQTRYEHAFVRLNGNTGPADVLVYLTGPAWCGSGGCTALVLAPDRASYRVVTRITIVRAPIRVLSTSTNGWRDLGVWVEGGGIQPGYEARLPFNGKTYPSNPSVPPAQPAGKNVKGETAIRRAERRE